MKKIKLLAAFIFVTAIAIINLTQFANFQSKDLKLNSLISLENANAETGPIRDCWSRFTLGGEDTGVLCGTDGSTTYGCCTSYEISFVNYLKTCQQDEW